jgi:hypothetical protein
MRISLPIESIQAEFDGRDERRQRAKRTVGELLRGEAADLAVCEALGTTRFDSQDYVERPRALVEKRRQELTGFGRYAG